MSEERMRILEMIAQGTITAEQGAQLIRALDEAESLPAESEPADAGPEDSFAPESLEASADFVELFDETETSAGDAPSAPPPAPEATGSSFNPSPALRRWKQFWFIPLGIGAVITMLSGLLLFAGIRGDWNWFWMSCVWLPLLLGIFVIMLSWMSRTARWLHVRVNTGQEEWPRRIAISLPLPLRFTAFILRVFGRFIPGLDDVPIPVDEAVLALEKSLSPDDPLYVNVQDAGGERVEIYIG